MFVNYYINYCICTLLHQFHPYNIFSDRADFGLPVPPFFIFDQAAVKLCFTVKCYVLLVSAMFRGMCYVLQVSAMFYSLLNFAGQILEFGRQIVLEA